MNKLTFLILMSLLTIGLAAQNLEVEGGKLYQNVMSKVASWGTTDDTMFVVGATKAEQMAEIRASFPNHFLLVPGVGAQGGSLEDVCKNACNSEGGLLINSSRGVIYAGSGIDYAEIAGQEAQKLQAVMANYL